jgi:hypothetical protein
MIRIDRGPEPDALTLARDEHLARARLRGDAPKDIVGYEVSRRPLSSRQSYKCAYCEMWLRDEAAPVEHYRPKGKAHDIDWGSLAARRIMNAADHEDDARFARGLPPRRDGFDRLRWQARPGYWWLAWTWENLVFGCHGCNSGVKNTRFPQAAAACPLTMHQPPPGKERPLLLDPTSSDPVDDPLDHIQYLPVHGKWLPTPRDGSPRGAWTIALLRLDSSPALLTAYASRVSVLDRCVRDFEAARASGDANEIRLLWRALCNDVLAGHEQFLGLTYDWLDARYPAPWRYDHRLELDRPVLQAPDLDPAVPAKPAVTPLPALDGLPEQLCDWIRVARNFQAPTGQRLQPSIEHKPLSELVMDILRHRPDATDDELAALLNRAPATIRKHRR